MKNEFLKWYRLEDSFAFEIGHSLRLPLVWPTHRAKVREEEFHFHEKIGVEILRFNVDLCPEKPDIINFNFFFAVTNKESPWCERSLVVRQCRSRNMVVVYVPWTLLLPLFLLRDSWREDAVGVRVVKLCKVGILQRLTSSPRLL